LTVAPPVRSAFVRAAWRLSLQFAVVFYGADLITGLHSWRVPVHMDWEHRIPYWPATYPIYFSVFALPFVVLAVARDAAEVQRWERGMALAIGLAGVIFLLLPADLGYAPADAGAWQGWATFAAWSAGRHNLLPSLHVALALITVLAAWPRTAPPWRGVLAGWFVLLVASVLLTHQHHVADVLAGVALAILVVRRRSRRAGAG
jgi:hypothetical protein